MTEGMGIIVRVVLSGSGISKRAGMDHRLAVAVSSLGVSVVVGCIIRNRHRSGLREQWIPVSRIHMGRESGKVASTQASKRKEEF